MKKKISIVTPCYNEEENVEELSKAVKSIFENLNYDYEHIFIDNASTDNTIKKLRQLAQNDINVKVILNTKNFGHIRSPYYGLLQAYGDAVILVAADFQDPPNLIPKLIEEWEKGHPLVLAIKSKSEESPLVFALRKLYYKVIAKTSSSEHISNFTGFGLYNQSFIETLRKVDDPYPYFRGMVAELGNNYSKIEFTQPIRTKGKTKNNINTLYDMAMLGFVNQSKLPLRMACFIGFILAILSLLTGVGYMVYKLMYWDSFSIGIAPLIISLFFFSSVQLIFIGIIGEYIGAIYTQVHKRPLVIEKERINF
ncbi:glycosyltransferase family 2 protein [Bacteroides sp. 224]|uniref:glycosyltransferase family 2 protein n=1 Tax=Bacteroides sp. 224 TaxID=2302936 RepID=UPI0013D40119|nr:glycosyltransferase family 2 protein [Bacteroides sp. 224]NDV64458.1 glycosyltransferase [Bacteroides sp. 224]